MNICKGIFLVLFLPTIATSQDSVRIFGQVTDFHRAPIAQADVRVMDHRFQPVAHTVSNDSGLYELRVPKGRYMALVVIRDSDYRSSRLEYWAWNVLAEQDQRIDPRYHRLEIYAMNAFRPQGGYPSYLIYFRPMSLSMVETGIARDSLFSKREVLNIAPELDEPDLEVHINKERVRILTMTRVKESGGTSLLYGYLIQCELPKQPSASSVDEIRITAKDPATGDEGEGLLFYERPW